MSPADKFRILVQKPLETIQGTIAIAMTLFGLFLVTPIYSPSGMSATSIAFGDDFGLRLVFAFVLLILPAVPTFLSWFNISFRSRKWRSRSCFAMFFGVGTLTFLRLLTIGPNPPVWLFTATTAIVCAILYLYWQVRD